MYAVLETGSKQYRVTVGDTVEIERLEVEPGQAVTFDRILLVNNDGKLSVGSPTVASASILADVVDNIRGEKKLTYKLKRRKGYRKTIGHRQELTVVKIKEITGEGGVKLAVKAPEAKAQKQESAAAGETPAPAAKP